MIDSRAQMMAREALGQALECLAAGNRIGAEATIEVAMIRYAELASPHQHNQTCLCGRKRL